MPVGGGALGRRSCRYYLRCLVLVYWAQYSVSTLYEAVSPRRSGFRPPSCRVRSLPSHVSAGPWFEALGGRGGPPRPPRQSSTVLDSPRQPRLLDARDARGTRRFARRAAPPPPRLALSRVLGPRRAAPRLVLSWSLNVLLFCAHCVAARFGAPVDQRAVASHQRDRHAAYSYYPRTRARVPPWARGWRARAPWSRGDVLWNCIVRSEGLCEEVVVRFFCRKILFVVLPGRPLARVRPLARARAPPPPPCP